MELNRKLTKKLNR